MLSTSLTGNMGDNLIRALICRTVAEKNNYKFGINPIVSHDYYGGKDQMWFFNDINYGEPNNTPYGELPPGTEFVWDEKKISYSWGDYYPFQPDVFDVPENTKLIFYCGQDARYLDKEKVKKWLTIKDDVALESKKILEDNHIELDSNTCLISPRGGEFRGNPALFLPIEYWINAIKHMKNINPKMKFIVFTEDPEFYKTWFDCPVVHFSPHCDYYAIHTAKNLIISNSGFTLFPIWTSEQNPYVIAPKYWSRYNAAQGWSGAYMPSWECLNFMDKEGRVEHYEPN